MAKKLSGKLSNLIHQMGRNREDRIFSGETKLTEPEPVDDDAPMELIAAGEFQMGSR